MESTKRRLTIGGRSDVNPLPATAENVHAGQRNFASFCMVCHGLDGQNTGVPFADKMAPPGSAAEFAAVQAYTDGQLHRIISEWNLPLGDAGFENILHDEEIWQLVLYVRHLPPKGSLGEPQVYGGQAD